MKVIDNRAKANETIFSQINVGDVFQAGDKQIYMKVCNVYSDFCDDWGYIIDTEVACNAVCLTTGKTGKFHSYSKATPLNCECVITDK